jgi:hypothetical protein
MFAVSLATPHAFPTLTTLVARGVPRPLAAYAMPPCHGLDER